MMNETLRRLAEEHGFALYCLETVDSTNTYALHLAKEGISRALVCAEQQTAGRGRLGRTWESSGENVYVSFLLDQPGDPCVALAAALAVTDAVALPGVQVKWPNDVLVDGAKLAGILVQAAGTHTVVGIGLNVNQTAFAPGLRATSLALLRSAPQHVEDALCALTCALPRRLNQLACGGFVALHREYTRLSSLVGETVTVHDGRERTGVCVGFGEDGALLLREHQTLHRVLSGEVTQKLKIEGDA